MVVLEAVPLLAYYGLATGLDEVVEMESWLFWRYLKAIRKDRVHLAISTAQSVASVLGEGKDIVKAWQAVLDEDKPKPKPAKPTPQSKAKALKSLASFFGGSGGSI